MLRRGGQGAGGRLRRQVLRMSTPAAGQVVEGAGLTRSDGAVARMCTIVEELASTGTGEGGSVRPVAAPPRVGSRATWPVSARPST